MGGLIFLHSSYLKHSSVQEKLSVRVSKSMHDKVLWFSHKMAHNCL